jgi:hypothetical protein
MNTANKQQPEVGDDSDSDRPLLKERPDGVQLRLLGRSAFGVSFFSRPSGFSRLLPFRNGAAEVESHATRTSRRTAHWCAMKSIYICEGETVRLLEGDADRIPFWQSGERGMVANHKLASFSVDLGLASPSSNRFAQSSRDLFEDHQMGFFSYPIVDPILSCGHQLNEVLWDGRVVSLQFRDPDPGLGNRPGWNFPE